MTNHSIVLRSSDQSDIVLAYQPATDAPCSTAGGRDKEVKEVATVYNEISRYNLRPVDKRGYTTTPVYQGNPLR